MKERRTTIKANKVQGPIFGNPNKVHQVYNGDTTPKYVLISALVFTSLLLIFMITAFFFTPNLTPDQRNMMHLIFSLLSGFSATFLGGSVLLKAEIGIGEKGKLGIAATSGIAVFIFVWLKAPYWFGG